MDLAHNDGTTPLYITACAGHTEAIKALLAGGAKVDLAKNDGTTPLYYSAKYGHIEAIKLLLAGGA